MTQTDFYASVAELIGHKLSDKKVPGSQVMWNVFSGTSEKGRKYLLEESVTLSLRYGDYKYIHPTKKKASWIKSEKNIESATSLEPQLYDLSKGVYESNNIAAKIEKHCKKKCRKK